MTYTDSISLSPSLFKAEKPALGIGDFFMQVLGLGDQLSQPVQLDIACACLSPALIVIGECSNNNNQERTASYEKARERQFEFHSIIYILLFEGCSILWREGETV